MYSISACISNSVEENLRKHYQIMAAENSIDHSRAISAFRFRGPNKCAMASIMDSLEPERIHQGSPLCPKLFHSPNPRPFKRLFANDVYVVLKV